MLHCWRTEIDRYVRAHALAFREDASNASLAPTRNRMRHKIIPLLEREFGRAIRKSIWRAALIASEEDVLLDGLVPATVAKLNVDSLGQQPVALQRRIIRDWLRAHDVRDLGFDLIERVRSLFETKGPANVNLPDNRYARRAAGQVMIVAAALRAARP
jgi:tRNA(Ile)-lysidine synthase